ncbi:MAG: hypothetical protein DRI36_00700 [Caldiserica bacterium]|nr:MAG: hypothetical protein DRI36_00700 [Caldisericota bacterium]
MKKLFLIGMVLIQVFYLFSATVIVADVKGDVFALVKGKWEKIEPDSILEDGAKIKTGKNGYAVLLLENGSEVKLWPNSILDLTSVDPKNVDLGLSIGKIKNKVKKLAKGESFKVTTPASVCAVRGTEFMVEVDEKGKTKITVFAGIVSAREISGIGEEILIRENEFLEIIPGVAPRESVPLKVEAPAKTISITDVKREYIDEVRMDMTKEEVQEAAARELKFAEYEEGKTMIDYFGKRVRIEEYIVRPADNQFKFVALNERDNRFDYFTWKATFNKELPEDLKVANEIAFNEPENGWSSEPEYWVKEHDCAISNTIDKVTWKRTRADWSQPEELTEWKIFPGGNEIVIVGEGKQISSKTLIPSSGGDSYTIKYDLTDGSSFSVDVDKTSSFAYDKYASDLSNNYKEEYYFIDDEGNLAKRSDYNANPLACNEELVITADNFKGPEGKIDLVVEPEIFIKAGFLKE